MTKNAPPSKDIHEALERLFSLAGISWENTLSIDNWLTISSVDDVAERLKILYDSQTRFTRELSEAKAGHLESERQLRAAHDALGEALEEPNALRSQLEQAHREAAALKELLSTLVNRSRIRMEHELTCDTALHFGPCSCGLSKLITDVDAALSTSAGNGFVRRDKIAPAIEELAQWESRLDHMRDKFEAILCGDPILNKTNNLAAAQAELAK